MAFSSNGFHRLAISLLVAVTTSAVLVSCASKGFANFQCPSIPNFLVPVPCNIDCQNNHNCVSGMCGNASAGDYACYCGADQTPPGINSSLPSVQCVSNSSAILEAAYEKVCKIDCTCNHASDVGTCDFDLKACKCSTVLGANTLCNYTSVATMLAAMNNLLP